MRVKKIVVIGSKDTNISSSDIRIDYFNWDEIRNIKNLRDYDTVIVQLIAGVKTSPKDIIKWSDYKEVFNVKNIYAVLTHEGEVIIIGDPRFSIPFYENRAKATKDQHSQESFLYWTGMEFSWDGSPGDTIDFDDDYDHRPFKNYVQKLTRWEYSLSKAVLNRGALSEYFNLDYLDTIGKLEIHSDFFCRNRYRNGLAFILRLVFSSTTRYEKADRWQLGRLIFLPKIQATAEDALNIVLTDICGGIGAPLSEPQWLSAYKAPGQEEIDDKINSIKTCIEAAKEKLLEAEDLRSQKRACLKLLYEREEHLEPVVREIIRRLGAHVEDPREKGKEDGWITVNVQGHIYEGVLEIKSTRSAQFNEDGIKQLLDWIDRGIRLREKKYKGIFIGNSSVDTPENERPWPFSNSWKKSVELHCMCALTTLDLYKIYLLNSSGKISPDQFWRDIFETNGIFDIKKYLGNSPTQL